LRHNLGSGNGRRLKTRVDPPPPAHNSQHNSSRRGSA
jgi:hypothetical protein